MKRLLLLVVALVGVHWIAQAQSTVARISWLDIEQTRYDGLLVLYPNNQGQLFVHFYNPSVGNVVVAQNAQLSNTYDMYGNCTSFVYCSYPRTSPYTPYTADNFVFYPNGAVYTQDYSGKWSTAVVYRVLPPNEWNDAYEDFGLN